MLMKFWGARVPIHFKNFLRELRECLQYWLGIFISMNHSCCWGLGATKLGPRKKRSSRWLSSLGPTKGKMHLGSVDGVLKWSRIDCGTFWIFNLHWREGFPIQPYFPDEALGSGSHSLHRRLKLRWSTSKLPDLDKDGIRKQRPQEKT